MSKKQKNLLNDNKLLEVKISDSLTNLEEYTRIMTDGIDFDSFDVLSVTRIDTDEPYTRKFARRRVEPQAYQFDSDNLESPPMGVAKNKLN